MNTIYPLMKQAFHPIITIFRTKKRTLEADSYLVRGEPACLRVYLEVLVGGHDAVLDLAGGVELVAPGVPVLGPDLNHHRAWNKIA